MYYIKVKHQYLQNEGDIINKIFDSKKHQKGGYLSLFPTVGRNFGDFRFMLQKEIFIIFRITKKERRKYYLSSDF